jgi:hypothetical protein
VRSIRSRIEKKWWQNSKAELIDQFSDEYQIPEEAHNIKKPMQHMVHLKVIKNC